MSYDITITFPSIVYEVEVTFPSIVYTIEVTYPDITQYQIEINYLEISASNIEINFPSTVYVIEVEVGTGNMSLADLQALLDDYELHLGNPAANGYILSSTTAGVRSWIENLNLQYEELNVTFTLHGNGRYYATITHNKNSVLLNAFVKKQSDDMKIGVGIENSNVNSLELWADTDPGTVNVRLS